METRMLNVKINGRDYQVSEGTTILKAARDYADVDVPTLCYLEGISEEGGCGMCMVEVKGARTLQRSCITRIAEGMEITTDSERVSGARKTNLELALAHHPLDCMTCDADGDCELQRRASSSKNVRHLKHSKKLPGIQTHLSNLIPRNVFSAADVLRLVRTRRLLKL
jgi:NADH dehydrogenase/NADH:ubiquinone oxidoreductase subunit G